MLNRIVFLTIQDKFEVVRLRGKIYFTNCTLCSGPSHFLLHRGLELAVLAETLLYVI